MAASGHGTPSYKRNRTKPRYGRNEQVRGGVKKRTERRVKAMGGWADKINTRDGITGREARQVRNMWIKNGKPQRDPNPDTTPRRSRRSGPGGQPKRNPSPEQLQRRDDRRQVRAETRLQFGPQERELDYQRQQEQQFQTNLGGYYAQHQQDMLKAQAFQAGVAEGARNAAYGAATNAATTDSSQNQQLLQQQQASAAQRGTTVDPALQASMQQGVAARQVMGNAGGNLIGAQGQAQTAFMGNRVQVAGEQGIQAQTDEQNRIRKLDQLAADLAADKGAFKVKATRELQETRHKQGLEDAAFGLDVADQAHDNALQDKSERRQARTARQSAARNRLLNKQTRESIRTSKGKRALDKNADLADDGKRNFSTDYDEWTQKGGGGDKGASSGSGGSSGGSKPSSFTPTQVRSGRRSLRNLVGRVKNNVDPPDSVDPLLARAAVQIADHGGVTPELARKIKRQYGFTPKIKRGHKGSLTPRNADGTPG